MNKNKVIKLNFSRLYFCSLESETLILAMQTLATASS